MNARRLNSIRGRPEHRNEYSDHRAGAHRPGTNAHALPGNGEWNGHHSPSVTGNAVTGGVERFNLEV